MLRRKSNAYREVKSDYFHLTLTVCMRISAIIGGNLPPGGFSEKIKIALCHALQLVALTTVKQDVSIRGPKN